VSFGTEQYRCQTPSRAIEVRGHPTLNGIDYLEVLDDDSPFERLRQRILLVHCFKPIPALTAENVRIEGGVRVTNVGVRWALPAPSVSASLLVADDPPADASAEADFFHGLPEPDRVLVVRTDSSGDFSTYRFSIVPSAKAPSLTEDFDPQLSSTTLSFKVDCPSEFDCRPDDECPEPRPESPPIDYLAKDYASFRRIMLDRLALLVPAWRERSPADLGVALVELLAYGADHLSYYQDAVATETYLGTARQRISVRRHARLLDYRMHDGANARAWVHLETDAAAVPVPKGSRLLTAIEASRGSIDAARISAALSEGALVFETLHDITVRWDHNEITFHTWGDERCCLPAGATRATLVDRGHALQDLAVKDMLIFEERRGPDTGRLVDADSSHRHAVRLTEVTFAEDPAVFEDVGHTQALRVAEVAWAPEDALPFPLCLWEVPDETGQPAPVSRALGNVVLADHGLTLRNDLPTVPAGRTYGPILPTGPLTQQRQAATAIGELVAVDADRSAAAAMALGLEDARPWVTLHEEGAVEVTWSPQADLLGSDRFASEFVVEIDDDALAHLRFGDGVFGRLPAPATELTAEYRVGNGTVGNVGSDAIAHVTVNNITDVRNPIPATGGIDPERSEQVRMFAPQAFRRQERAVTEEDYAAVAQRHPEVQKAAATRRWTGSWYTVFVTVDRVEGRPVDEEFRAELRDFIDRFRLGGYDIEIDEPRFVPLDIAFTVCAEDGHFRSDVKEVLLKTFGKSDLSDGRRGFFHPDNFTFGQPVYLSQVIAEAMGVPGVESLDFDDSLPKPNRFRRWGQPPHGEIDAGKIAFGRLEIARLDNDPSLPENGRIHFFMQGGL
jgi:hypothetical protein